MEYLGIERIELESKAAIHTAKEIKQQPEIWIEILNEFKTNNQNLSSFFTSIGSEFNKIILTGAGTSAYIGLSLKGVFFRRFGIDTIPVPTTDLVTHPLDFVRKEDKVLLVSFARSGNSPESTAAAELCEQVSSKCAHLIITCNSDGALYNFETKSPKFTLLLPEASNDQGLAMTSSYTGMLLAGLLVSYYRDIDFLETQVSTLSQCVSNVISEHNDILQEISRKPFDRVVCLGSGPFFGTAYEARLKILELTAGKVVSSLDSYLGFRHGPKAIITENTLMVYFISNDPYVNQYEMDLINSIKEDSKPLWSIAVSSQPQEMAQDNNTEILINNEHTLIEELLAVGFIVPIQILSFHKSLNCGLDPDKPSVNGAIHRVVQGVKIYSPNGIFKKG